MSLRFPLRFYLAAFLFSVVDLQAGVGASASTPAFSSNIALLPAGTFRPQYGLEPNQKGFKVIPFRLDRSPVDQLNFSKFLKDSPDFRPERIKRVLAEERYLSDWKRGSRDWKPNPKNIHHPIIYVSWFAANAYCESVKGRLPTTLEWEYAAAASATRADASQDQAFLAKILNWYARATAVRDVKKEPPNLYGIYDLHGLIWEWTSDFNSSFITMDNREDGEQSKNLFCGNSGQGAENRANYAAFMRYAMRSSLRPNYVTEHLGFRCAYDIPK